MRRLVAFLVLALGACNGTPAQQAPGTLSCPESIESFCARAGSNCPATPCAVVTGPLEDAVGSDCDGFDVVAASSTGYDPFLSYYFDHQTGALVAAIRNEFVMDTPRSINSYPHCLAGPSEILGTPNIYGTCKAPDGFCANGQPSRSATGCACLPGQFCNYTEGCDPPHWECTSNTATICASTSPGAITVCDCSNRPLSVCGGSQDLHGRSPWHVCPPDAGGDGGTD